MKLANYRSGMLRFSVSLLLISTIIFSNLFFYYSSRIKDNKDLQQAYYSSQDASVSGVIFDNSLEIPSCFIGSEKVIENGFENPNGLDTEINYKSNHVSVLENSFTSFEIGKNSQGLHIAHYLKNCAIKIPFHLV